MADLEHIDEVLRSAISHRDMPGVVAMATTRDGVAYQGAFGRRALPDGAAMTTETVFWSALLPHSVESKENAGDPICHGQVGRGCASLAGIPPGLSAFGASGATRTDRGRGCVTAEGFQR